MPEPGRLQSGNRQVEMLGLTVHHHALDRAARLVHEAFDPGAETHIDAQLGRPGRSRRDQGLVAPAQAAHPLA